MAEIKWIKLSVNMFDDEKIKLIRTMPEGDSIVIIWVQILCLAGKINDSGAVYMGQNLAYSDEMLATILGHPLNIMRVALQTLEQFEMIEVADGGTIEIINWEKHQNIDGMERIRKQNRERKKRFDLKKKIEQLGYNPNDKNVPYDVEELENYFEKIGTLGSNAQRTLSNVTNENDDNNMYESHNVSVSDSNVTVTSGNATDKNRIEEEKIRIDKKESSSKGEKNLASDDSQIIESFSLFQKLWMFPNVVQQETLQEFIELYSDDLVSAAIKIAGSKDVKKGQSIAFIEAVLKEWVDGNVKTLEEAREYEKNRGKQKKNFNYNNSKPRKQETLPDWAKEDYEPETNKENDFDKKELEDRLRKIREMRVEE